MIRNLQKSKVNQQNAVHHPKEMVNRIFFYFTWIFLINCLKALLRFSVVLAYGAFVAPR